MRILTSRPSIVSLTPMHIHAVEVASCCKGKQRECLSSYRAGWKEYLAVAGYAAELAKRPGRPVDMQDYELPTRIVLGNSDEGRSVKIVDRKLEHMIERRADSVPDHDEREESYMESVRRYHGHRRHEALWEKLRYHEAMLEAHTRTFTGLLDKHKAGRERCERMLGIGKENI